MKIGLYLNILFLALVIKIVTANVRLQRSPQQYCGSRLADMMKMLCATKYNEKPSLKPVKRGQMDMYMWDYKDLADNYNEIDYPAYKSKLDSMTFVPNVVTPSKRKIIDECCHKPCYISELRSYCAV